MFLDDFLRELDAMIEDLELEGVDETTRTLEVLIPELIILCENQWLLELILDFCKRRNRGKSD